MEDKVTVIYIIADRRSGSTLLENMLSKSGEIISIGELAMLKGHIDKSGPGFFWNWNCSCGKPVLQCKFWSNVLQNIYDENFQTKIKWPFKSLKIIAAVLLGKPACNNLIKFINSKNNPSTIHLINQIYKSISITLDKKIIVDSSKDPVQALAVSKCKNVNAKYIWLKRDVRAITYSKIKRAQANKSNAKSAFRILLATVFYKKLCSAVLNCLKKQDMLVVSYEKLTANPEPELNKIRKYFGLKNFVVPEFMELMNDHTIGGTPDRFQRRRIIQDTSWKNFYLHKPILNILGKIANAV